MILRSQQLGIRDNVFFRKYDPQITQKLTNYDVGFNCSVSEGFGRVTVEYMMNEVCPVVSSGGANTELVENGKNGFIYQNNNAGELAKILLLLIENRNYVYEAGVMAKKFAVDNFSMNIHTKKIVNLYNEIVGN